MIVHNNLFDKNKFKKRSRTMKKIKMAGIVCLLVLSMSSVFAYAKNMGNYHFNFSIGVWGKTSFSLKGKDTSTDSTADTYRKNSTVKNKATYVVDLDGDGAFKPNYYGVIHYADGGTYTTTYGVIKKNTYTINVTTPDDLNPSGYSIIGSGYIYQ